MELVKVVGANLRAARLLRGLSLSETARRAGIGKGTLSELEAGRRNPTLETLYALATVLDAPLGRLLVAESGGSAEEAVVVNRASGSDLSGQTVDVQLMDRVFSGGQQLEVYRLHVRAGARYVSSAHRPRVIEQLLVHSGTLVVGPESAPETLGPGDYIRFDGGVDHVYQALEDDACATLVMRYVDPA
ncbi:helix-turn-helix domain-containing protein [Saccharopolyspora sp. ASAGF58]|uniref:helix-turn-helix domain-containing protein n=1 Tax=Saccharopolyspora sp. ASAGF58 TaxID=2719023 RepID=UPI00143FBAB7|nr:XRE family transcriptional regulator [Saccharopolyspora sp. ASAGF58]QIZ36924.1 helix-turn-helix domain-containing protein [Saccharopolyspora sp. ASAGF58]